jgi:hypothetical protein
MGPRHEDLHFLEVLVGEEHEGFWISELLLLQHLCIFAKA